MYYTVVITFTFWFVYFKVFYFFKSMSGDSPAHLPFKKKDEESLLISERPLGPIATAASAGAVVASVEPPKSGTEIEDEKAEKQEFIRHSKEDSKVCC